MRPLILQSQINQAIEILKNGGLVAIPTETVYGLAADASNKDAVKKIFAAKGRPTDHPLIVHIANIEQLSDWAKDIPDYAHQLVQHYWPGPMTLILKKQPHVLDVVTGGQDTVGIRIPNHPVAQQLLQNFGGGLAAPSANSFGYISPTSAQHVRDDLGDEIDMILDGGPCEVGIESTIIDCTGESPRILRPGMLLEGVKCSFDSYDNNFQNTSRREVSNEHLTPSPPRVSGALDSHYAPRTLTRLLTTRTIDELFEKQDTKNIVIISLRHKKTTSSHWIMMPNNPQAYAHQLYEQLHRADNLKCEEIWIEEVPNNSEWNGIRDRIVKASG